MAPVFGRRFGRAGRCLVAVASTACGANAVTAPGPSGPTLPSGDLVRTAEANPIVRNGPELYDALKAGPRSILRMGPGDYRMWYEAVRNDAPLTTAAAYATSTDGRVWEKHPGNPVMVASEPWEGPEVSPTAVLWDDGVGLFRLWYHGGGNEAPRGIGYATSSDGLVWRKHPQNPVLEPGPPGSWDDRFIADAKVIRVGPGNWLMWYRGVRASDGLSQVGLARSVDGVSWTKDPANPVFSPSSDAWDRGLIQGVGVVRNPVSGVFHMWYPADGSSSPDGDDGIGYACSRDGRNWVRASPRPVLEPNADPGAPDHLLGDTVDAYLDGSRYRIVYGAFNFSWSPVLRGMAEATIDVPAVPEVCRA